MDICFLIPGMPFNGDTLSSDKSLGGSETMGALLAQELGRRGHQVKVFGNTTEQGKWGNVVYLNVGPTGQPNVFGAAFHQFADHVPHDVLVIQRNPTAFHRRYAAKINFWWTHDLALKRYKGMVDTQAWNVDRFLAVSEFHRAQLAEVYGLDPKRIAVQPNGILLERFKRQQTADAKRHGKRILYSSRPERGLENLLIIAEKMLEKDPTIRFQVCGYDNTTPDMAPLYQRLWAKCQALPNVDLLGSKSQNELAEIMGGAWLHCYPTGFEETSCITAMEEQAAGTPFLTSKVGALPETLDGGGAWWVEEEGPDPFVKAILHLRDQPDKWDLLREKALAKAPQYSVAKAADQFEEHVEAVFREGTGSRQRMAAHFLYHSDIWPLKEFLEEEPEDTENGVEQAIRDEMRLCYKFAFEDQFEEHYNSYYEREKLKNHPTYSNLNVDGEGRFEATCQEIAKMGLPENGLVIDWGCGHGHYVASMARRFPRLRFLGMDRVAFNVEIADKWLAEQPPEMQERIEFRQGTQENIPELPEADLILACEVLEHINDPVETTDKLATRLKPGGWMLLSTPYGPWEAIGYEKEWPWRAHLWHFEAEDLRAIFGHHPGFHLGVIPCSAGDYKVGSFLTMYQKPTKPNGVSLTSRKFKRQNPPETLSVCMIVRGDGGGLVRTLRSVRPLASEIRLFIDGPGRAWEIGEEFRADCFTAESPLEIGFDEARNRSITGAAGDWILWIDDDEELLYPERLRKFLRGNTYDAYAIHHDHISGEPAGVLKTDLPCRIFRNRNGFKFYGMVHEHPERGGMNQGAGRVMLLPRSEGSILHTGYTSEEVRRARFQRNWPLMQKDHGRNPERQLGQFLWLRDLVHLNRFELERGIPLNQEMIRRASEGVDTWRKIVRNGLAPMAFDGLPYYGECVELLTQGGGLLFGCAVEAGIMGIGDSLTGNPPPTIRGRFLTREDAEAVLGLMLKEKLGGLEGKYL